MKINKIIFTCLIIIFAINILFTSCKEKTGYTIVSTTNDSASQIIISNDELHLNYELDQAINELLLATNISKTSSGDSNFTTTGNALFTIVKNAEIDTTSLLDSGLIKLTYYGVNADNTKGRTGTIILGLTLDSAGKVIPWKTQGVVANITFVQYEVIVIATNKSLWLNGSGTITNRSGGVLKNIANLTLPIGDSLIDKLSAQLAFTYNDNTNILQTYTWNFNRIRVFKLNDTTITSTITGDSTLNNFSNISTAGTTRSSQSFFTGITSPVIQNIYNSFILTNPIRGEKVIHGITEPIDMIFGVDKTGNPQPINPFGYKISWINNGGQAQSVVSY